MAVCSSFYPTLIILKRRPIFQYNLAVLYVSTAKSYAAKPCRNVLYMPWCKFDIRAKEHFGSKFLNRRKFKDTDMNSSALHAASTLDSASFNHT